MKETLDTAGPNTMHRNKIVPLILALFIITALKNYFFSFNIVHFGVLKIKYDILKHLNNTFTRMTFSVELGNPDFLWILLK